jgi:hypothetical protein
MEIIYELPTGAEILLTSIIIFQAIVFCWLHSRERKEKNDLMNRLMARSLADYTTNVAKMEGKDKPSREAVLEALADIDHQDSIPID